MPDLRRQSKKILCACRSGDQQALEGLFQELDIGPNHPRHPGEYEQGLTKEERTPTVHSMLYAAIQGEQVDMVKFLCSKFPRTSLDRGPLARAVDIGNVQLVKAMCKLDPASADGAYSHMNILAYACSKPENADIVSVLLKAGADPNKPAEHTPPFSNASYAVAGGMPVSTFEQFFDCGYRFDDGWAVRRAIERKRQDVLEVLFARGRGLPTARLDPEEKLVELAREYDALEMVDLIKRVYPRKSKKSGFVDTVFKKLHLRS